MTVTRRVQVEGRDDIGEVVQEGTNLGEVYCVAVRFPNTGEVVYYEKSRVRTLVDV